MASVEDTWMQPLVRLWNTLASLPAAHVFAPVARGDCFLGVTTRLPTWAGSVLKAVPDLGYPYTIDAQSMYPIDHQAIK